MIDDPRPDLREDSRDWSALLTAAYADSGEDAYGLFGTLHALRCLGAKLDRNGNSVLRISAGDIPPAEYAAIRQDWLFPHQSRLTEYLRRVAA